MINSEQVNLELISTTIKKIPKYEAALRYLAFGRKRGRQGTTFRALYRNLNKEKANSWTMEEIEQFFGLMQKAGGGEVIYGGDTPKFRWAYHLQSLAYAVLGIPEPVRKRKDGSVINSPGQLRKPSPERNFIPRIGEAPKLPRGISSTGAFNPTSAAGRSLITLVKSFCRELDVSHMSPEACRKLTDILLIINKHS